MPTMHHSTCGDAQVYVGRVRAALQKAVSSLGVSLSKDEINPLLTAMFEALEGQRMVVLPQTPTKAMVDASLSAMADTKRSKLTWVKTQEKHQWRLYRALLAAPDWREGLRLDAERRARDRAASARIEEAA